MKTIFQWRNEWVDVDQVMTGKLTAEQFISTLKQTAAPTGLRPFLPETGEMGRGFRTVELYHKTKEKGQKLSKHF